MKKFLKAISLALAVAMSLAVFAGCDADSGTSSLISNIASSSGGLPSIANPTSSSDPTSNITSIPVPSVGGEVITLLGKGSEFKCKTLTTEEFNTFITDTPTWKDKDYDVSAWTAANAPLGDRIGSSPIGWGGVDQEPHGLLAVTTFEIEDLEALKDKGFKMNIFYDNTINMYINGTLVFSHVGESDWVDDYTELDFSVDISEILVEGTNTLSVSLLDGWGGRELDLEIIAQ